MKDNSANGWTGIVNLLEANSIRHKRKRDENFKWDKLIACWISFKNIFELFRNVNICNLENIKININYLKI